MNIFDQAMDLEKEGEALYRKFAADAKDEGMKKIFTWLAEQEVKHCQVFKELKASTSAAAAESPVLTDIRNIFAGWVDDVHSGETKPAEADAYRLALDIEKKSISVYENYANTSANALHKDIFLTIAKEEKRHEWIVENIIEFVTKPQAWAENAEFSHLEEDYYL